MNFLVLGASLAISLCCVLCRLLPRELLHDRRDVPWVCDTLLHCLPMVLSLSRNHRCVFHSRLYPCFNFVLLQTCRPCLRVLNLSFVWVRSEDASTCECFPHLLSLGDNVPWTAAATAKCCHVDGIRNGSLWRLKLESKETPTPVKKATERGRDIDESTDAA